MKQQNFLFVGGSQDGQVMALQNASPEMRFPVMNQTSAAYSAEVRPPSPTDAVKFTTERYLLERLRADEETFFLYRHESLTIADVLKKLLAGYKPEAS
jgi:hypothetical protein